LRQVQLDHFPKKLGKIIGAKQIIKRLFVTKGENAAEKPKNL
jgi:hypothetical protein